MSFLLRFVLRCWEGLLQGGLAFAQASHFPGHGARGWFVVQAVQQHCSPAFPIVSAPGAANSDWKRSAIFDHGLNLDERENASLQAAENC